MEQPGVGFHLASWKKAKQKKRIKAEGTAASSTMLGTRMSWDAYGDCTCEEKVADFLEGLSD